MFLLGQWQNRASVIKFQKRNMQVDWKIEIKAADGAAAPETLMNEIYAYVQPPGSNQIYACGYRYDRPLDEKTRTASILQMDTEGDVTVLYTFGDAVTTGTGGV